jgi:hypothetical protein
MAGVLIRVDPPAMLHCRASFLPDGKSSTEFIVMMQMMMNTTFYILVIPTSLKKVRKMPML